MIKRCSFLIGLIALLVLPALADKSTEGLEIQVRPVKNSFVEGEPLRVEVTIRNGGDGVQVLSGWSLSLSVFGINNSRVKPRDGVYAPHSEGRVESFGGSLARTFKKGEKFRRRYVVDGYLPAGEYTMRAYLDPIQIMRERQPAEPLGSKAASFEVTVPRGQDATAWEDGVKEKFNKGATWAGSFSSEFAAEFVEKHPQSVYAPYAFYYCLRDYAGFLERYPEHPLAAEAAMEWAKALMSIYPAWWLVDTGKYTPEHVWSGEKGSRHLAGIRTQADVAAKIRSLLKWVREKHPDSDAAWLAPHAEKLLALKEDSLDALWGRAEPAPALEARAEAIARDAAGTWVEQSARELIKSLQSMREENERRKGKAK